MIKEIMNMIKAEWAVNKMKVVVFASFGIVGLIALLSIIF